MRRQHGLQLAVLGIALALALGCSPTDPNAQRSFATPEEALRAMGEAIESDDVEALLAVFGPQHRDALVTPDWSAQREARQKIGAAAREQHELEELGEGEFQLVIGAERWPFPIPLVQGEDGSWGFDTTQGLEVMIDRRIGRNELSAIEVVDAYVDAQIEYAREDRDADGRLEYAQRLASTPGQRDGLYWEAEPGEALSPFGPVMKGAEAYLEKLEPGDPFHGYYFKVLTRQGEHPSGRARDYVVGGRMITGFALVAYPADYGNSGIMTFVVNHRSEIREKDIGAFDGMDAYAPDETWSGVVFDEQDRAPSSGS